jgi:hypothetical protein
MAAFMLEPDCGLRGGLASTTAGIPAHSAAATTTAATQYDASRAAKLPSPDANPLVLPRASQAGVPIANFVHIRGDLGTNFAISRTLAKLVKLAWHRP